MMASTEKITIPISKAAFVTVAIVGFVINVLTVYFTVQLQFQQQKNDLVLAVEKINNQIALIVQELKNKDEKLDSKIDATKDDVKDLKDYISDGNKPDEVKKKVKE